MEKIGVREAKNSLSQYLQRVKKGEIITITERGVPVAKLIPVEEGFPREASRMLEGGLAAWKGGKPGGRTPLKLKNQGKKTLAEIVVEDRR
ncbi:MAG: type II toxin-antitoxin system Phd/YefM family antitoxin [Dethiobacter sp.]|jgi:prevent-host-death family protein|nr:MAG: type II toxin-antitoxin system Phd/YefM family antitoxin [Dethiobacter sp.]